MHTMHYHSYFFVIIINKKKFGFSLEYIQNKEKGCKTFLAFQI